jgi:hypothetical protein
MDKILMLIVAGFIAFLIVNQEKPVEATHEDPVVIEIRSLRQEMAETRQPIIIDTGAILKTVGVLDSRLDGINERLDRYDDLIDGRFSKMEITLFTKLDEFIAKSNADSNYFHQEISTVRKNQELNKQEQEALENFKSKLALKEQRLLRRERAVILQEH